MFPFISTQDNDDSSTITTIDTPCEYAYDVINNQFKLKDNKMYYVYGKEALRIWLYKACRTPRGIYFAYSWNFGHDLESLIGSGLSRGAMVSEAQRMVRECVTKNPHVTGIKEFQAIFEDVFMHIYFTAITDQGDITVDFNTQGGI